MKHQQEHGEWSAFKVTFTRCSHFSEDVENGSGYFDVPLEAFNVFMKTTTGAF